MVPRGTMGAVVFGTVLAIGGVLLASSSSDEPAPSTSTTVVIAWGDPLLTEGDLVTPIGPDWCLTAQKSGGAWVGAGTESPLPGWVVLESDTNNAALQIRLAGSDPRGDLAIGVTLDGASGADLALDVLDADAAPLAVGVWNCVVESPGVAVQHWTVLPLADWPSAATLQLRRRSGGLVVYNTMLSIAGSDRAGFGLAEVGAAVPAVSAADLLTCATSNAWTEGVSEALIVGDADVAAGPETLSDSARTNSAARIPALATIAYVDSRNGQDVFTGRRPLAASAAALIAASTGDGTQEVDGPKASIAAGLGVVAAGGIVRVRSGLYGEDVDLADRSVSVEIEGDVDLSGGAVIPTPIRSISGSVTNSLRPAERVSP